VSFRIGNFWGCVNLKIKALEGWSQYKNGRDLFSKPVIVHKQKCSHSKQENEEWRGLPFNYKGRAAIFSLRAVCNFLFFCVVTVIEVTYL